MNSLKFPYTWSNPHASTETVQENVLLHPRFTDLVRLVHLYGAAPLFSTLKNLIADGELSERAASETADMLRNIEAGVNEFEHDHSSCRARPSIKYL